MSTIVRTPQAYVDGGGFASRTDRRIPHDRPIRADGDGVERLAMATQSGLDTRCEPPAQDVFAVESQGAIQDRPRENLATSDIVIARGRRMLLDAIDGLKDGGDPPFVLREESDNAFTDLLVLTASIEPDEDPFAHCASVAEAGDYHAMT